MTTKIQNNKILNNSIMLMIFQIAKILFPFITLPYLTRILSTESYGIVTYVKTIMTYMQIFIDFGFVLSGTKDIVKYFSDKKKLGFIIGDTLLARTILGVVGFIIILILSYTLPILKEYKLYTFLSYVVVFESIYLMDFVFRGYEKMHIITIRFVLMKIISTALTFLLIKSESDLLLIPALDIISSLISILLVLYEMKKLNLKLKISNFINSLIKIKESFIYFISNVASTSFNALSTIIIGIILSKSDVAFWGLCMQIIGTIHACYSPFTDAIYPEMIRTKNIGIIKKIIKIFTPILIIGCIIAYFVAPLGINLLAGDKYTTAVPVFRYLIPSLFFGFYGILYGWPVLGAIDKQKQTTLSTVISIIINILLYGILIITNNFTLVNIAVVRVLTDIVLFGIRYYFYRKYSDEFVDDRKNLKG